MRFDGGHVRRAKRLFAAAIVGALCLLGALSAAAESDSLAPQTPEVVVKRASTTSLLFTWSPVDRAAGYDLYLGTVHVGPTTYTRAEFPKLACSTRYVLRVVAFDGASRRSTPSLTNATTDTCASSSSVGGDSSSKPRRYPSPRRRPVRHRRRRHPRPGHQVVLLRHREVRRQRAWLSRRMDPTRTRALLRRRVRVLIGLI